MILAILKFLKEQWSCCCIFCTNGLNWLHWMFKRYYPKVLFQQRLFDSSSSPSSLNDAKENWVNEASNSSPLPFFTPFFKLLIRLWRCYTMKSNSWRGEEVRTNEVREEMSTQTVFQIGFLLNRNFFLREGLFCTLHWRLIFVWSLNVHTHKLLALCLLASMCFCKVLLKTLVHVEVCCGKWNMSLKLSTSALVADQ